MRNILAIDIGGTNSRFGHFHIGENGDIVYIGGLWLKTNAASSFDDLMQQIFSYEAFLPDVPWDAVVLAVPGPVRNNTYAAMANVEWTVDVRNLRARLSGTRIFLINDFVAQVYACPLADQLSTAVVQEGKGQAGGNIAIVGAGTGLGHCALTRGRDGTYIPLPSEAGHASFSFQGNIETGYGAYITEKTGIKYPVGDIVVSGPGLVLLHAYLTGRQLTPSQVVEEIDSQSDTTILFSRFYGRACRNYTLAILALGGLYISGGIAAKNPYLVLNDHFRNEFTDSAHFREILTNIPVTLMLTEDTGLWGAANYGALQLT